MRATDAADESDRYHLRRFLNAQEGLHEGALREVRSGRKQTHWMWYFFPQVAGLGKSSTR